MMIINLFNKNIFLTNDSLMIREFFLFTNMCIPDYKNRLDINKSYELFTMLLKKYNKKKNLKDQKENLIN